MEPLGGSSLIASAGTDINMQDDEDMNAVFISLLCTILSPGGGGAEIHQKQNRQSNPFRESSWYPPVQNS